MYARFINPLIQFGKKQYDLVIFDGDRIVSRQNVKFDEDITDEQMEAYANNVIELMIDEDIIIDKPQD